MQARISGVRKKSQGGSAILEFAIGWTLLWFAFSGTYYVGYSYYVYNRLASAVANAGMLGAKMSYDSSNVSAYTAALKNMVVYGDTSTGTAPLVPNLTTSNVTVTLTPSGAVPQFVTITITGYTIDALFTTVALSNRPQATFPFYGQITG